MTWGIQNGWGEENIEGPTRNPDMLALLERTLTCKRFPHCLFKAFF